MKTKRHQLGQVFLADKNYIRTIFGVCALSDAHIVEIGPGKGAMTEGLLSCAASYVGVEYDRCLCDALKNRYADNPRAQFVQADILRYRLPEAPHQYVVYGNIPYYASAQIIGWLIAQRPFLARAYIVCQSEFAAKLIAEPGSQAYGVLTCHIQAYSVVTQLLAIPRSAFTPIPHVDSMCMCIDFCPGGSRKNGMPICDDEVFVSVLRNAFVSRRKKIKNSSFSLEALSQAGIDPSGRPEVISVGSYIALANYIAQK